MMVASYEVEYSFSVKDDDDFNAEAKVEALANYLKVGLENYLIEPTTTGGVVTVKFSAPTSTAAAEVSAKLKDKNEVAKNLDVPVDKLEADSPEIKMVSVDQSPPPPAPPSPPPPPLPSPLPEGAAYAATISFTLEIGGTSRRLQEVNGRRLSEALTAEAVKEDLDYALKEYKDDMSSLEVTGGPQKFDVEIVVKGDKAQAVYDEVSSPTFKDDLPPRLKDMQPEISSPAVTLTVVYPPSSPPPPPSSTSSTGPSPPPPKDDSDELSGTAVALIIVCVIVAVLLVIGLAFTLYMRNKRQQAAESKVEMDGDAPVSRTQV